MILRKPYALFIKYFKIIHLIMALLIGILIYRTGVLLSFFNTYLEDYNVAINGFELGATINIYSFILALLVIVATILVMSVMIVKKKPKLLYIYNLVLYVGVIIFFMISYSVLRDVTSAILDIRISKAIRDVSVMFIALEVISFIFMLVRATGFDLKKFDFGTDIQALDISEKDSEEIEVAVEFDKNKARRKLRRKLRDVWYTYVEHRFVFNLAGIILVIVIAFSIYFNISIYSASYGEDDYFSASGFSMNVTDSYIVDNDYAGNTLTSNVSLAVIKFEIRRNYITTKTLNTGLITLRVGNDSYGQTTIYNGELEDLGTGYVDQKLTDDYESYFLVFAVPKGTHLNGAKLKINDNVSYVNGQMGAKNIFVKLNLQNIDENVQTFNNKITDTIDFSDSILKDTKLTVNEVSIANSFKATYNFCASQNYCYESSEYITPTATGNYTKSLMRIKGSLDISDNVNPAGVADLRSFFNMFATLEYQVNGTTKTAKINSQSVKPNTAKENNVYYIEIPREANNASSMKIIFKIRQMTYNYTIK